MLDSLFILTYPHVVCKLCVNKKSTKCEQSHFVDFQSGKRKSDRVFRSILIFNKFHLKSSGLNVL